MLGLAVLCLFSGMPPDGRGVEQDLCSLQCGQPGTLRIPLVPADQDADTAELRVEGAKAEVAGSEVKLLVEQGIIRDVHLAIEAANLAVGVDDRSRVVIQAWRAALEQRADDDDAVLLRRGA